MGVLLNALTISHKVTEFKFRKGSEGYVVTKYVITKKCSWSCEIWYKKINLKKYDTEYMNFS